MINKFNLDTVADPENMNMLIEGINKNEEDITAVKESVEEVGSAIGQNASDLNAHKADVVSHGKYVEGMEYLIHYHDKLRKKEYVKIILSGDSTTYGTSITDEKYKLYNLVKSTLRKYGVINLESINAGHENKNATDWINSYLTNDLSQNPDLYVIRWGFNHDGTVNLQQRVINFERDLRSGLTTIRASKNANQLSLILMTPNSGNDIENGRDKTWFDLIQPIIKKASRDFQCCFIDTYNYLLDSTNVTWQDEVMPNPNTHVHPLETANAWIVSLMSEPIIPTSFRSYGVTNILSSETLKNSTDAPSTYPYGVSLYRSNTGFPFDGEVYTLLSNDSIALQINSSYKSQNKEGIAIRRGIANHGVPGSIGDDAWSPWLYINNTETSIDLILENSWVNYGSTYSTAQFYMDSSGLVHINGLIKGGVITQSTTIATLPIGYRPLKDMFVTTTCDAGIATLQISSDGTIKCINVPSSQWWLTLDSIAPFRVV